MTKKFNLRRMAKMTVACLAVAAVFISCEKDETGGGGSIGGSQSPMGEQGSSFSLISSVSGVGSPSAQVVSLEGGISTVSVSANITSATYRNILSAMTDVDISGNSAVRTSQYRFTDKGIQSVYPEGNLNIVKYDAKVGDVYTLKRGGQTIRREVTVVSNENSYAWNGMNIKTIHVKETGRGIPGVDYIEFVSNHRFGLVGLKVFFEDGSTLNLPLRSSATN